MKIMFALLTSTSLFYVTSVASAAQSNPASTVYQPLQYSCVGSVTSPNIDQQGITVTFKSTNSKHVFEVAPSSLETLVGHLGSYSVYLSYNGNKSFLILKDNSVVKQVTGNQTSSLELTETDGTQTLSLSCVPFVD